MVAYRPKPKSLVRRLASNTVFQMASVSILIFVVFAYVREQNHKDHLARLELDKQSEKFAKARQARMEQRAAEEQMAQSALVEESPAEDTAEIIEPPAPSQATSASLVQPKAGAPAAATGAATGASKTAASPINPTAAKPADSVRVTFIEAHRPLINELLSSAGQVAIAGPLSAGVVPGIQARLTAARGENSWRTLESSAFQAMKPNQPNMIFKGTRDQATGQNLGFTIQVLPTTRDEQGTLLQIDVLRALREGGGPVEETAFPLPDGFNVPPGGAVVISGVLPHRQVNEAEERLYRGASVLKVMTDEAFRSGQTEAVIIIETK
ncbi:MAG TPA: hypothetical protein VM432_10390 [Bdellovibrionales bacterium]|nr:hypothetical protein [Bdellovibrionales bacterium]